MRVFCSLQAAVFAAGVLSTPAIATEADEAVRGSLVHLHVSGRTETGEPLEESASGFFVSKSGLILTVYHAISKLGRIVPESLEIKARIGDDEGQPYEASIVDGNPNLDLLLLKIDEGHDRKIVPVTLGQASGVSSDDELRLQGFSKGREHDTRKGTITSRDSRAGTLWKTDIGIDAGMSGGPVYDASGAVVGIAKGEEQDSDINYIIPIEFADTLITQILFQDIREKMQRLADLIGGAPDAPQIAGRGKMYERLVELETAIATMQNKFEWSATIVNDNLEVKYKKALPGGIAPEALAVKFLVKGTSITTGLASQTLVPKEYSSEDVVSDDVVGEGKFVFQGLNGAITTMIDLNDLQPSTAEVWAQISPQFAAGTAPAIRGEQVRVGNLQAGH